MSGPVIAMISILTATMLDSEFNWETSVLSELGIWSKISGLVFNIGLIISGLIASAFTIGLFRYAQNIITRIGSLSLLASTLSLSSIGIFNIESSYHDMAAFLFFVLMPVTMFIMAAGFAIEQKYVFCVGSIVTGITIALMDLGMSYDFFSGDGIAEFIVALASSIWIFILGYVLLKPIKVSL